MSILECEAVNYGLVITVVAAHVVFNRLQFKDLRLPLVLLSVIPAGNVLFQWYYFERALGPWSITSAYMAFYVGLGLSVVLYRLSPLHPLYSFPGPRLGRISKLWGVWVSWKGRQHIVLKSLHDKYGPFVRTGPNEVSVLDTQAILSVLGANGLPKGVFYDTRSDPAAPKNLIVLKGEEHANRRRIWNRGMSTESLTEYEGMIARRADQFVETIGKISGPVDMVMWLSFFSFDFMGDMAFGGGFELLKAGQDKDGLWKVLDDYMATQSLMSHIPWAAQALSRLPYIFERVQRLRTFGAQSAMARVKNGSIKKDLWYHLTDEAGLEKEKPPVKNVVSDGALAIVAGADTTARATTSLLFFLLSNPEYYVRLRAELDATFAIGDNVFDTSKYASLTFLEACINESLRLLPPVPTNGSRRVQEGSGGRMIAGRVVPEGTEVYVPSYSLHRDPRNFYPHTEEFWPERWLQSDSDAPPGFVHNAAAFIPFSYGPANCVGRQLARLEIKMLLTLLLSTFDVRFAEGFDRKIWEESLFDYFILTAKKPMNVLLTRR